MDEILLKRMEQKVRDTLSNTDEIRQLVRLLSDVDDSESFAMGIAVGRIYNSFYYQTKRILGREPTDAEFREFLEFVRGRRSDLEGLW